MERSLEGVTPEQKVILEALERVDKERIQRDLVSESEQPPEEIPEIPENLEDVGKHSLNEFGMLGRIGKGTRTFDLAGNDVMLRTLTQGEELEILSRINAFPPSAQSRAYVIYTTAVSIETVNGKPYFEKMPLGPRDDIYAHKFRHFIELYPVTINAIIDEYQKLRTEMENKARYAKKG